MDSMNRRSFITSSASAAGVIAGVAASGTAAAEAPRNRSHAGASAGPGRVPPRFTTTNSVVMLVDHQIGTLSWVKSLPTDTVVTTCRVLTRMATDYAMPLMLTTTLEQQVGTTIKRRASR